MKLPSIFVLQPQIPASRLAAVPFAARSADGLLSDELRRRSHDCVLNVPADRSAAVR